MGGNNTRNRTAEEEEQRPGEVLILEATGANYIYCDDDGQLAFNSLQQPQNFSWTRMGSDRFCLSRQVNGNQFFLSVGRRKLLGCRKVR